MFLRSDAVDEGLTGMVYPYHYAWRNNAKRATMYGKRLRIIRRYAMNSAFVEFEDGSREVISRNAIRRIK
jgi:hypothetical protein